MRRAVAEMEALVVKPNDVLYNAGDAARYVYVVEGGSVSEWTRGEATAGGDVIQSPRRVRRGIDGGGDDDGGDDENGGDYLPGDVIGHLAMVYGGARERTTRANDKGAKLWGMHRRWFERVAGAAVHGKRGVLRRFFADAPIARRLPASERIDLTEAMDEAVYRAGDVIIAQGDAPDRFYLLEVGAAVATVRVPGVENALRVAEFSRGSYFGELELFSKKKRTATVTATTSTRCAAIEWRRFAHLAREGTELRRRLLQEMRGYVTCAVSEAYLNEAASAAS